MISKEAFRIEKLLRGVGFKRICSRMMLKPRRNEKNELPPYLFSDRHNTEIREISAVKCISVRSTENPERHILYFHGGAYSLQANRRHWGIIDFVLKEVQCMITFINYPLVPESTCADTIERVMDVYQALCGEGPQEIILMGDSAGGGLALALAQTIKARNIMPAPSKIVLFSPWLDVSMDSIISDIKAKQDVILDADVLKIAGERYAGNMHTKDPRCSPLYGDLEGIGPIALFTGTKDILYGQAEALKDKVLGCNGRIVLHEYEEMHHVWMVFPIPEGRDVLQKACAFIKES
ncbi:MAG: alpha/beta hydrolase [Saccharofermentanales bacterium]